MMESASYCVLTTKLIFVHEDVDPLMSVELSRT